MSRTAGKTTRGFVSGVTKANFLIPRLLISSLEFHAAMSDEACCA
jgi:hypothetical protein